MVTRRWGGHALAVDSGGVCGAACLSGAGPGDGGPLSPALARDAARCTQCTAVRAAERAQAGLPTKRPHAASSPRRGIGGSLVQRQKHWNEGTPNGAHRDILRKDVAATNGLAPPWVDRSESGTRKDLKKGSQGHRPRRRTKQRARLATPSKAAGTKVINPGAWTSNPPHPPRPPVQSRQHESHQPTRENKQHARPAAHPPSQVTASGSS